MSFNPKKHFKTKKPNEKQGKLLKKTVKYPSYPTPSSTIIINSSNTNQNQLSSQVSSVSIDNDYDILCLNWNTFGNSLCTTSQNQIKIWLLYPQSGLKCNLKKQISDVDIIDVKYADQNIFAVLSCQKVKFYDTRQGIFRGVCQIFSQANQSYSLFDISQKTNYFTIGDYFTFKNYDFRFLKNNADKKSIIQYNTQTAIYDIKWSELSTKILLSSGGYQNHGFLSLHSQNLQKLNQLQLHSSQIISLSFDKKFSKIATLSDQNTVQIAQLPEILCESVISMPEQLNLISCHFNFNAESIAIVQSTQVWIYETKKTQNPQQILKINKNSTVSWHPSKNLLAYISQRQQKVPQLIKI